MSSILNYQQSHLDLNKIESINKCQLVDLINNFTINYLDKLKTLMVKIDARLFKLNSKIIVCQSNLCILESRIASVPILKEFKDAEFKNISKEDNQNKLDDHLINQTDLKEQTNLVSQQSIDQTDEHNDNKQIDNNPELIKYRKMINVGVPQDAVKLKMKVDGYDPDLLK